MNNTVYTPEYDVSIIIVNYNTIDLVSDCITSIICHTKHIKYEIIVIDNNSHDRCEEVMQSFIQDNPDIIKFRRLPSNIGFGQANNVGFSMSNGRYLFCLNGDTILKSNAIKILKDFLDSNGDAGACGGNLIDLNGDPTHSYLKIFPGPVLDINKFLNRLKGRNKTNSNNEFNHTDQNIEVASVIGADLMIKRNIIDEIGGFNKNIFMFYEETELQYRIRKAGYHIYNVPAAVIIHLEGKSFVKSRQSDVNYKRWAFVEEGRREYNKIALNFIERSVSRTFYAFLFLLDTLTTADKTSRFKLKLSLMSYKKLKNIANDFRKQ